MIISYIIPLLGSFFAFLALMITRKLLLWIQVKLNVVVDDKFQADLNDTVKEGVWAAEEMAAKAVKQNLPCWTSKMKHAWVINLIAKQFPMLTKDQADNKINAMLGKSAGLGANPFKGEEITITIPSQPIPDTCKEPLYKISNEIPEEVSKNL